MAIVTQQVEVFWTVRGGRRFTIAMSEQHARDGLNQYWAYSDDPVGWTIERTTETVPIVRGKPFVAERTLRDLDGEQIQDDEIEAPHVAWDCPHCNRRHTTDLCHDMECKTPPDESPQLWFCERSRSQQIVLVTW